MQPDQSTEKEHSKHSWVRWIFPVMCMQCEDAPCIETCPEEAIRKRGDGIVWIDEDKCIGCGECIAMCVYGAMSPRWDSSAELLSKKMVEYAHAVLKDKKAIFVSFIMDISPDCDCWHMNRPAVTPDIGIAASTDPVALDQACIDLVLQNAGEDPFLKAHPNITWRTQLEYAEEIGLGSREYELIKVACEVDKNK